MAQYIDKSALVAEIDRRTTNIKEYCLREGHDASFDVVPEQLSHILSFINTLEVKEVKEEPVSENLEEAVNDAKDLDIEKTLNGFQNFYAHENSGEFPSAIEIARHFYELGLQVNNPVTAADRGFAEEIIINLKRVENDYHLDLTREMEWLRNKTKKGE